MMSSLHPQTVFNVQNSHLNMRAKFYVYGNKHFVKVLTINDLLLYQCDPYQMRHFINQIAWNNVEWIEWAKHNKNANYLFKSKPPQEDEFPYIATDYELSLQIMNSAPELDQNLWNLKDTIYRGYRIMVFTFKQMRQALVKSNMTPFIKYSNQPQINTDSINDKLQSYVELYIHIQ